MDGRIAIGLVLIAIDEEEASPQGVLVAGDSLASGHEVSGVGRVERGAGG